MSFTNPWTVLNRRRSPCSIHQSRSRHGWWFSERQRSLYFPFSFSICFLPVFVHPSVWTHRLPCILSVSLFLSPSLPLFLDNALDDAEGDCDHDVLLCFDSFFMFNIQDREGTSIYWIKLQYKSRYIYNPWFSVTLYRCKYLLKAIFSWLRNTNWGNRT